MVVYLLQELNERNFYDVIAVFEDPQDAKNYVPYELDYIWEEKHTNRWTSNRINGTQYLIEGWKIL